MKITILGAGVAASDYLKGDNVNRYPPGFLVTWGEDNQLLFECSTGIDRRLEDAGYDYADIHSIAISHPHPDHCAPIHFYQSVFCKGVFGGTKNQQLTFYGPDYLIDNFDTNFSLYVPDWETKRFEYPAVELVAMSQGDKVISIGDGKLSAKKVYHAWGKCDAVSYRLETPEGIVAYSGDTGDCEGIRAIAQGADVLICEASARIGDMDSPKGYGHLTPSVVGEIAKEAGVKKIILFHYTGLDSDEAMIEEVKRVGFTGDVIAGKDFQEILMSNSLHNS